MIDDSHPINAWLLCCVFQPDTNFLLGNLLAAKGNFTGAVWHYLRALQAEPEHTDALEYLRVVSCYTRYHGNQQRSEQQCQTPAQVSHCYTLPPWQPAAERAAMVRRRPRSVTATHCYTLLHTATPATHCYTLLHTAAHCYTLLHLLHTAVPATHCYTLLHTATHCYKLIHLLHTVTPATHCYTLLHLLHTVTHCYTLLHTATHCYTLLHTATPATHCYTLLHTATHCYTLLHLLHTATHCYTCYTLLHTATHCYTLLHTATHCYTLLHTATHCYTCYTLLHTATHCCTCYTLLHLLHTATHCYTLLHLLHTATPATMATSSGASSNVRRRPRSVTATPATHCYHGHQQRGEPVIILNYFLALCLDAVVKRNVSKHQPIFGT